MPNDKLATPDGRPAPKQGNTQSTIDQEPAPRLPHENDQSADQQASPLDPNVVQAGKDIERGLVDTDRGKVMDDTYKKQKSGGAS